jgi:hypothetical protein
LEDQDMSALRALDAARAAGIEVRLVGKNLEISAADEPPADVLDMLRRNKNSIVGLLQQPTQPWDVVDWRAYFDERAAIAEYGGLPRPAAEARAFECCVAEWRGRNPVYSAPDRCLVCAATDRPPLLPIGIAGAGQAWLHRDCVSGWHAGRIATAVASLSAMKIASSRGPCTVQEKVNHQPRRIS